MTEFESFIYFLKHARYLEVVKSPRGREFTLHKHSTWNESYGPLRESHIAHPNVTEIQLGGGTGSGTNSCRFFFNRHGDLISHGVDI